jgi:F-type H+-transporting ATPase subunit c
MKTLTVAILMLLSTLGPSMVIGYVGYGAVKALGRNPSAAPRIFLSMMLAFAFAEAIAIIALLVIFNLFR